MQRQNRQAELQNELLMLQIRVRDLARQDHALEIARGAIDAGEVAELARVDASRQSLAADRVILENQVIRCNDAILVNNNMTQATRPTIIVPPDLFVPPTLARAAVAAVPAQGGNPAIPAVAAVAGNPGYPHVDVDVVGLRKFCEQHDHEMNYRLLVESILEYGTAHGFTHNNYKYAFKCLLKGEAQEDFRILRPDPLQEIVNHLLEVYSTTISPQEATILLRTFKRRKMESINAAMRRFGVLLKRRATVFPNANHPRQSDEAMIEELYKHVGPLTEATLRTHQDNQNTVYGLIVTYQDLLLMASQTEIANREYNSKTGFVPVDLDFASMSVNTIDFDVNAVGAKDLAKSRRLQRTSPMQSIAVGKTDGRSKHKGAQPRESQSPQPTAFLQHLLRLLPLLRKRHLLSWRIITRSHLLRELRHQQLILTQ